jgi:hypothetical protein
MLGVRALPFAEKSGNIEATFRVKGNKSSNKAGTVDTMTKDRLINLSLRLNNPQERSRSERRSLEKEV